MSINGRIHSFESCGTVDGPGIRFIVFLQGCLMRCKYCHNCDTWDLDGGREVNVKDIMKELVTYRHFIDASGGGLTASGGEAMLQPEFVFDLFRAAQAEGIHTCLDTNGHIRKYTDIVDDVLSATDLVMLDLKQMNDTMHKSLVGVSNKRTLDFARYLQQRCQKTWIRYVIVPGYTDDEDSIRQLGEFLKGMDNVEKVEMLPLHQLGAYKWEILGYEYELKDINPPTTRTMENLKSILEDYNLKVMY
ncbi:pyruvate formate lyase 1-activating protein [Candidatus Enterovibrio escicola]|uniref:Pyruvate formate-lyase-activating enzyme n=1 Tax=Candidatus Enterovibrio escicola TaxID=1927127 RepID=A0A2A5T0N4_9GAMM|nr:pyruvate formate lyase 1-activating protein [Candidatus Enterovibrio escacola]PCS21690.1 Pyruvate formate-lyase activating enzyme [Candidatus Enterovibrio escacola]